MKRRPLGLSEAELAQWVWDQSLYEEATGCRVWPGYKRNGYGAVFITGEDGRKRSWPCHRLTYHYRQGYLHRAVALDHLCRNRACVDPNHLEPVTHLENARRMRAFHGLVAVRNDHFDRAEEMAARMLALEDALRDLDPEHPLFTEV